MGETDGLRELHERYVWAVNAAVAEGRMDLVWELSDEYTDEALRLMIAIESPTSEGPGRSTSYQSPRIPRRRRRFWHRYPKAS